MEKISIEKIREQLETRTPEEILEEAKFMGVEVEEEVTEKLAEIYYTDFEEFENDGILYYKDEYSADGVAVPVYVFRKDGKELAIDAIGIINDDDLIEVVESELLCNDTLAYAR